MSTKEPNIQRIDIYRTDDFPHRRETHGWQVRFQREGNKRITKFFSDSKFEGADGALKAAREWRDGVVKELPEPLDGLVVAQMKRSRTGVPGVRLRIDKGGKYYVEATWINRFENKPMARRFRIKKPKQQDSIHAACWNACLTKARAESWSNERLASAFTKVLHYVEQQLTARRKKKVPKVEPVPEA